LIGWSLEKAMEIACGNYLIVDEAFKEVKNNLYH